MRLLWRSLAIEKSEAIEISEKISSGVLLIKKLITEVLLLHGHERETNFLTLFINNHISADKQLFASVLDFIRIYSTHTKTRN